jgi:L-iditol 2-dehydrogenase
VAFAGVAGVPGTIRRFMVHEAQYCHKMAEEMTFAQGALLEPLSVILHAIRQCNGSIGIGKPVLVCGAGPIGLIALAAAKASGAWPLVITDVEESRLEFAQQFVPGAQIYHVKQDKTPLETAEEIREIFGCGRCRDVSKGVPAENEYDAPSTVLECTGIESSVITAAYSCRRGGVVMVVGVGRSIMNNLPFMHLSLAEIELKFINRYSDTWPAGIRALTNGRVLNLDALVTHTFPLERAVDALQVCADRTKQSIKIQIVDDVEIVI